MRPASRRRRLWRHRQRPAFRGGADCRGGDQGERRKGNCCGGRRVARSRRRFDRFVRAGRVWRPHPSRQQRRLRAPSPVCRPDAGRLRPHVRRPCPGRVLDDQGVPAGHALTQVRRHREHGFAARTDRRGRARPLQRREGRNHRLDQIAGARGERAWRPCQRGRAGPDQHPARAGALRGLAQGQGQRAAARALRRAGGGRRGGGFPLLR